MARRVKALAIVEESVEVKQEEEEGEPPLDYHQPGIIRVQHIQWSGCEHVLAKIEDVHSPGD